MTIRPKASRNRKVDPREQFSKKLAGRTEWFWFWYMTLLAAVIAYAPESGIPVVYLAILVTGVMITSVLAYTSNSKYDKFLYTLRVIERIKIPGSIGSKSKSEDADEGDPDEDDPEEDDQDENDPDEDEGGGNG